MGKRRRIRELECELQTERDDYQHTHDVMWKLLTVLCEEFGLGLTVRPKEKSDKQQT